MLAQARVLYFSFACPILSALLQKQVAVFNLLYDLESYSILKSLLHNVTGQFICGNKHCDEKDGLASYEVRYSSHYN
jgi:hypothetical protein